MCNVGTTGPRTPFQPLAHARALRRALERYVHFDEVHAIWQQHHWQGDGYAAWATMPGERYFS